MEERPQRSQPLSRAMSMNKPIPAPAVPPPSSDYQHQYEQITTVIGDLNEKLTDKFHRRESEVLDEYKAELEAVQRQLLELRNNTNEEGLRRRLAEKCDELEKERTQHLQLSMFFSGKCEVFKEKVSKMLHQNKDLENEIRYLEQQMNTVPQPKKPKAKKAAEKLKPIEVDNHLLHTPSNQQNTVKGRLLHKLYTAGNTKQTDKVPALLDTKSKSPEQQASLQYTQHHNLSVDVQSDLTKGLSHLGTTTPQRSRKKLKADKLKQILEDPLLKETEFERLFLQSVQKMKDKKSNKTNILPQIRRAVNEKPIDDALSEHASTKISDGDLNDFDKRSVVQDFLSREDVKHHLYVLLFGRDPEPLFLKNRPKAEVFEKRF